MSNAPEVEAPLVESSPAVDSEDALRDLVARADLLDVRVTKWHAELLTESPVEVGELNLKVISAFRYRGDGFDTRFTVDAPLSSPTDDEEVASIQIQIVATFSLAEDGRPDRLLMRKFMDQVAFFVVMPFIREGLHSLSMRIGLEPITLGLLHQGKDTPSTAWSKKRGVSTVRGFAEAE
ncbi:hypothetical protein [Micromonospora sp. NPDC093244]|uniref:hypothetical protein n=1 Tax=Micromonospora sp. NPDC093244 TaxID=3155071 RepID=UPI003431B5DE